MKNGGSDCVPAPVLPSDWWEQLKREYPKRNGDQGWIHVRSFVPRALTLGAKWETILKGTRAYRKHCDLTGKTGSEYVKQARTFFGPGHYFEEWAEMEPSKVSANPRKSIDERLAELDPTGEGARKLGI